MKAESSPMIDMRGALDLHLHAAPSLFPRLATDRQVAEACASAGLSGMLLKSHHESTVDRARELDADYAGMRVFGGIVLNSHVGGINPQAVQIALRKGAKQVWLPTIDAAQHAEVFGGTGGFDAQSMTGAKQGVEGIVLVKEGELLPEVNAVMGLVAEHDAILGTAHQSYEELRLIIPAAREAGVTKILLTHPFFKVPGLSLDQTKDLVALGAMVEFTYCTVSPMWACASMADITQAIKALGAEKCVLTSDAGQPENPMPPQALCIFAQSLFEAGIPEDDIGVMIRTNPAKLLGVRPA